MMRNFLWSDNIWIEKDKSWFVGANINALFEIENNTGICKLVDDLPDLEIMGFRKNSRCMKYNNDIFCFPDMGERIYVYDLINDKFDSIEIDNPENIRINMTNFWCYNDKLYVLSNGLREIFEIDPSIKEITKICKIVDNEDVLAKSIKVEQYIYITSLTNNKIYEYDICSNSVNCYLIPFIKKIFTISYDGTNFWLSGYDKAIYIWNKEANNVRKIDTFPFGFGIYNFELNEQIIDYESKEFNVPIFQDSIFTDKCVWFIPFQTNKIVFVDKDTYEVNYFEIGDEEENIETLKNRRFSVKYIFQYFRDGKVMGLYSIKKEKILEINMQEMLWKYKEIKLENEDKILNKVKNRIFHENNYDDRVIFKALLELH